MSRLRTLASRYRHGYLLVALVVLIFAKPFLGAPASYGKLDVFDLMFGVAMAAAVYTSAQRRAELVVFGVLAGGAVVSRAIWRLGDASETVAIVHASIAAVTWGWAAVVVLRAVFGATQRVTADTLFAAVSGYLLLGLLWTLLYAILYAAAPESFAFGERRVDDPLGAEQNLLGFSFVTLTTVGYGNIAPRTPPADALATLEAIVGQMYVAILVARLVGVQVAQATAVQVVTGMTEQQRPL